MPAHFASYNKHKTLCFHGKHVLCSPRSLFFLDSHRCCCAGAVSSVVQVQLQVLCSRYQGYESSPPGCTIRFSEVHPLYFVRPINGSVSIPPIPTVFTADLAFNRPVLGPQSRNSLYGMLSGQGVPDGRWVPIFVYSRNKSHDDRKIADAWCPC